MQSIKKNFIYQASYELLVVLLPIITSPYVSRVLGAFNQGVHSYTYTIANYFVLFAALGIKNYGNREISRVRDDQEKLDVVYSGILFLHFIVSGIVLLAYVVYILFFVSEEYKLYAIIQGVYVVTAFFDISWLFFGIEKFKITVTRNTLIKIASIVCIFVFVRKAEDLWIYILILAVSNFIGQIYLWFYVGKYAHVKRVSKNEVIRHLPQLLILFVPTVAISIYNYMDKIMVGGMSGEEQLGFYENSEKIIFVASSVIGSVGTVMLPRMSNIVAKGETEKRDRYLRDSVKLVAFISFALAFGIASVANVFSVVFWGEEYSPCGILLVLLAVILPVKGFASVLRTQYLIPNRKDKSYTISVCIGAVVNVVFNYIFIPMYGAAGASIGTILAELAVCIAQTIVCSRDLKVASYLKSMLIYFVPGILMFLIVYYIGILGGVSVLTLVIQVLSGIFIYLGLMLLYVLIVKDDFFYRHLKDFMATIKKGSRG